MHSQPSRRKVGVSTPGVGVSVRLAISWVKFPPSLSRPCPYAARARWELSWLPAGLPQAL